MRIKIRKGAFCTADCCLKCGWFDPPDLYLRAVCPKCGGMLVSAVGRYVFEEKRYFFGLFRSESVIAFERKAC